MFCGTHVSIAGGIYNAPLNAAAETAECFQMFTRSPRGGRAASLTDDVIRQFKDNCASAGITHVYVHAPYYINFASANNKVRHGSMTVIREELERASALGVTALMTHLGSAKDVGPEKAIDMTIQGLTKTLDGYDGSCRFLVENAAGAGAIIGSSFEDVKAIVHGVNNYDVGVCFDTCHAFASGYDLRTSTAVDTTLEAFDTHVGLDRLVVIHANDSQGDLDSHKDRHEHIGKGAIGMAGWKALVGHTKLHDVDLVLETPPGDGRDTDLKTLKRLRDE